MLDLNQRPHPYQGCALPPELIAHNGMLPNFNNWKRVEDGKNSLFLRKEVIQPQVPLRLPCYDFTPVADPTVADSLQKVRISSSGKTNSHGVTGGVYKARERIHRGVLIHDY